MEDNNQKGCDLISIIYKIENSLLNDPAELERTLVKAAERGGYPVSQPIFSEFGGVINISMTSKNYGIHMFVYPEQSSIWLNIHSETSQKKRKIFEYFKEAFKPASVLVIN